MSKFVTIRSFVFAPQAQMYQSYLESEGVFVFLKDELTVQSQPLWSNAVGGVKLQVRAEDEDRASALVRLLEAEEGIATTEEELDNAAPFERNSTMGKAVIIAIVLFVLILILLVR